MSNLIALDRIKEILYVQKNSNYSDLLITYYDKIHNINRTQLKLEIILNEFKEKNIYVLHIPKHKVSYKQNVVDYKEYWVNANMISHIKPIFDNSSEITLSYNNRKILEWTVELSVEEIVKYCPKIFSRI
jgi:uncharacterized protein YlzI (FlbEa/FlbD family)